MAFADASGARPVTECSLRIPITLKADVVVVAGDPITYDSGWTLAADDSSGAVFVALSDGVGGDEIMVTPHALVGGLSGATPGEPVYLADGGYAASGSVACGVFMTSTTAYIDGA